MKHALKHLVLTVAFVGASLVASPQARAQDPDAGDKSSQDAEGSRATSFVAVEGPQTEDVPGGILMIGAYGIAWALLFGYLFMVASRARNLNTRIAALERK